MKQPGVDQIEHLAHIPGRRQVLGDGQNADRVGLHLQAEGVTELFVHQCYGVPDTDVADEVPRDAARGQGFSQFGEDFGEHRPLRRRAAGEAARTPTHLHLFTGYWDLFFWTLHV